MSYAFTIKGIEPSSDPAWQTAGPGLRAEFWRAVVAFGLEEKDRELAAGEDRYGNPMHPLAQYTIEHRKSAMGPADPHAPPLQPAHGLSRTRSLLAGRAHANYALFFWRKDPVSGQPWGKILAYHRAGSSKLPVRDVIGIAPATLERVKARALAWWNLRKLSAVPVPVAAKPGLPTPAPKFMTQAVPKYSPKNPANAIAKSKTRVSQIAINGDIYTLQGGSASMIQRMLANGTFSGFGKARGPGTAAAPPPVPAPPPPPPKPKPAPNPKPASAPAPKPKPKPAKNPASPAIPKSVEGLEVEKELGGSTGAELVRDEASGARFVLKRGRSEAHITEEMSADRAYQALGIAVPKFEQVRADGGVAKLAQFVEGKTLGELMRSDPAATEKAMEQLRKHFVADALMGNWDVIGLAHDNVIVDKAGKVWRIDNGGSFRYRAQGSKKGADQWSPVVGELDSMRDASINPSAAKVFGVLNEDQVKAQIKALLKKRDTLLVAVPEDLRDTLGKRLDYLADLVKPKPRPKRGEWRPSPASSFRKFQEIDQMEAWGKTASKAWGEGLSRDEARPLIQYAGDGYEWINRAARKGDYSDRPDYMTEEQAEQFVGRLETAMARARTPDAVVSYRGIREVSHMAVKPEDLGPGDLIEDRGFASTSLKEDRAAAFTSPGPSGALLVIRVPAGTQAVYVNGTGYGVYPTERELLLNRGSKMRVVDKKQDHMGRWIITTEVIP